jgi:PRC-barrel domain
MHLAGVQDKEMTHPALDDRSTASRSATSTPKRCADYTVYDPLGQKIGSVEEVYVDREGGPEYIRVRMRFFGRKSLLIPVQFVETDEQQRTLTVQRWEL